MIASAALLGAPPAGAQPPTKPPKQPPGTPSLSIRASATTITFGGTSRLTGRLRGRDNSGKTIALDQNPFPFPQFVALTTGRSDAQGDYAFTVRPNRHTKYRVRTVPASTYEPAVVSPEVLVRVRLRVGIRLSDATPRRGQRVRFFGTVAPKHNGRTAFVQRRRRDGRWVTVARTLTRDTTGNRSAIRGGCGFSAMGSSASASAGMQTMRPGLPARARFASTSSRRARAARHARPPRSLTRVRSGRATFGEFAAAVSGAALVVALFFDWYGYEVGPVEASASGWESLTAIDLVLVLVGATAVIQWVARGSGWLDRRALPLAPAAVVAAAGVIAFLLVVLRIIDLPDAAAAAELDGRRVGAFLALAAAAGIVLGGTAALGERGEPWRRDRRARLGSVDDVPPPPVVRDGGSGPAEP